MPLGIIEKGREKTTLVFDTWANVGEGELLICWDCTLDDQAKALFGQLVRHLGYLGRSESWVEAEPVDDAEVDGREFNAYPHVEGHNPGPGWEQVSLMAVDNPARYIAWREQAVKQAQDQAEESVQESAEAKGKTPTKTAIKKARDKAAVPYPPDLLGCLQRDTAWWKQHRWSQPPGSHREIYWRRADALEISPPVQRGWRQPRRIAAMLLALTTPTGNHSALPHVSRTLPQAELFHAAVVGRVGNGHSVDCPELTGKDGHGKPLRDGHRHAHVLPLDLDRDQHIDHILVYAPMELGDHAQRAIRSLRRTWTKGGVGELQLALAGEGALEELHRLSTPLNHEIGRLLGHRGGARRWISLTPFVPPRYEKKTGKKNDLMCQVNAELASRGMPAAEARHLRWNRDDTRPLRHFVRCRQRGGLPPRDIGYALELTFAEPVRGPIALGYGCHFGLGLFIAQQHG